MRERVKYYLEQFAQAKKYLCDKYDVELDDSLLSSFLAHRFDLNRIHEELIANPRFNPDDLSEVLETEYISYGGSIPYDIEEIEHLCNELTRAIIKQDGMVWHVHTCNIDSFPSKPHAHEYTLGVRLHLGNGALYKRRALVGHLSPKRLKEIRAKAAEKGIVLP